MERGASAIVGWDRLVDGKVGAGVPNAIVEIRRGAFLGSIATLSDGSFSFRIGNQTEFFGIIASWNGGGLDPATGEVRYAATAVSSYRPYPYS